jgi:hypothetical protein
MASPEDSNPPPWYKQFWPWFLIALPGSVVVASMFTIKIAVDSDDGLVSKDYYKEGKAIHMDASARQKARDLGIVANIEFAQSERVIRVDIDTDSLEAIGALQLALRHPTRADKDSLLDLQAVGPKTYQAEMPDLSSTAGWNVELTATDAKWELRGRANLNSDQKLTLQ